MAKRKELKYEADSQGCWIVTSHKPNKDGYSYMRRDCRIVRVHRYMYEIAKGEIPDGMVIRHICDNPRCCNPNHLVLGSQQENVQDRVERNRSAKGSNNGNTTLTEDEVREIRKRKLTAVKLAEAYHVSESTIRNIQRYRTWKHVV